MLSLQTIHLDTLELLKTLMRLPILKQMRLVGGTALALLVVKIVKWKKWSRRFFHFS